MIATNEVIKAVMQPHLEVTLVGVENDGLLPVEPPLHLQGQAADGRLEVRLLGIHHQSDAVLQGVLQGHVTFNGSTLWQGHRAVMPGGAYVCQDVHPLQHPLHLPLLLGRELVEQRLQLARLCGKNRRQKQLTRVP